MADCARLDFAITVTGGFAGRGVRLASWTRLQIQEGPMTFRLHHASDSSEENRH
jgi:hypothetical protein